MDRFMPQAKEDVKSGDELVKVRLITAEDEYSRMARMSNPSGYIGVIFDIEPGWHIYWKNPGDSGAAPSIKIEDVKGFEFGEPLWPAPERHESPGDILDYTFESEVMALVPYKTTGRPGDRVRWPSEAIIDWLVCKEVCLPGGATAPFDTSIKPEDQMRMIDDALKRLPIPATEANVDLRASFSEGKLNIHVPGAKQLIFFPDPSEDMVLPTDAFHEGKANADRLSLQYSHESQNAKVISGVLEIHRADGTEAFVQVSVPGPAANGAADDTKGTE